jgi:hypothetical protein
MAESSLTTPGAVSRRFLFSVATAAPVAAATSAFLGVSTPSSLQGLLDRYRDTGMRLRETEADYARTLQHIPATIRPGICESNTMCRWLEWTKEELRALGLPATMKSRPSQENFVKFFREAVRRDPENREELKREHMVRLDAWLTRRNIQKDWYRRTGLDVIIQQRHHLLAEKHRIERELMTLMIGPDKAAIDA